MTIAYSVPKLTMHGVTLGAVSFVLLMGFYGFLAIDAGQRLIYEANFVDREMLYLERQELRDEASKGQVIDSSGQPIWTRIISLGTSQKHIFGMDSYFDTHVYLAKMPSADAMVLGLHATLAGICMLFGAIQFLPAMRKRYPLWHRRLGKIFVIFGQVSMILSVIYLLRTRPDDTFGGLTFHVGLWVLAISVSASLWMAVYHIRRREIAQHQVYMALAYGLMLTAPLLRYDWMVLGGFLHQELSFNEINYAVNILLIPQSFLTAYLLVLINRWSQKQHSTVPTFTGARYSAWWIGASIVFSAACISTLFSRYFGELAVNSNPITQVLPFTVWVNHATATNGAELSRALFLLASCSAFIAFPLLLAASGFKHKGDNWSAFHVCVTWIFALASLIAGCVVVYWAWLVGLPSHDTASAGMGYLVCGIPSAIFGLLMSWACFKDKLTYYMEWAVFSLLFLASPAEFFWTLDFLSRINLHQHYVDQSHAYTLASAAGPTAAMLGFIYVASSSSRRHR